MGIGDNQEPFRRKGPNHTAFKQFSLTTLEMLL